MSDFFKKVYVTVFPESWHCALRFNQDSSSCLLNDTVTPFFVLPNTGRYWTADPFLFENKGQLYVFFEVFDRLKRKGLLGYREIAQNRFGNIHIIYESDNHLSYPFIYEKNGDIYILPESNKSGELFLLKAVHFPDKWEKETVLLQDKLADTTVFVHNGVTYYLTEKVDDSNQFDRLDLYYEENGKIVECANNPVKLDANTARCAGKVFHYDGNYIRPSQDCGVAYGEKLNFNRIAEISKDGYREELISTVRADDIHINAPNHYTGIHTYNKLCAVEIIDLKSKRRFNILNFVGIFYKFFKRFFK